MHISNHGSQICRFALKIQKEIENVSSNAVVEVDFYLFLVSNRALANRKTQNSDRDTFRLCCRRSGRTIGTYQNCFR